MLDDEIVSGTICLQGGVIQSVDPGRSSLPAAIDVGDNFVAPGLIEMHTDNLERHFVPRPSVVWPNGLAAALAHDAQMAAAGVTTVFDALSAGYVYGSKDARAAIFPRIVEAIEQGVDQSVFRIDHRLHLRCELSGADLIETIEPQINKRLIGLVSLMDHTPGQRQWRDLAAMKTYIMGTSHKTEAEYEDHVRDRVSQGAMNVAKNLPQVLEMCAIRQIILATHDDTTVEQVDDAVASGAVISEFPTTIEAAAAAKARGMSTVAGAPNVVRGGSHSGGVSVRELAERRILDGLSSDYVPASLLQAVERLHVLSGIALHQAMGMVTWRIADMLSLADRGRLRAGLRADILNFSLVGQTPVVRGLWSAGRRVL
jgi:alpha-D-ribose 1-methylphosphonate 5-triphosphate diphosphatase